MRKVMFCVASVFALAAVTVRADVETIPRIDADGVRIHKVNSKHQRGPTEIRVLLPDRIEKGKRYPVVYVLPVEANDGKQFGNGLAEIKKHDLHNKHGAICVEPTFADLPWYADHPTDAKLRQETYFLEVVLPFIDANCPVTMIRWLLGFSKSGWGAFSLLLRHPDVFAKAVAWDAPLTMAQPNKYGMGPIFGTQANFEKYQITKLFDSRGKELGRETRLMLLGYENFRTHHVEAHAQMNKLGIAHEYRDEKKTPHTWHSGWVEGGVKWLATGK